MDKKRIAFFTNTYLPTTSGVVRSISTFRQAFTNMGHNVFIFAQHDSDYEDTEPFIFRYPAVSIPFMPNQYSMPIPVSSCINQVIKSIKPDVIHSHHPFILGDAAADRAKKLKLPLVYTAHTRYDEYLHYIPLSHDIAEKVLLEVMTKYIEKCQHIVTPSESIKQLLEENGVSGPITAVPTGIDIKSFREADGSAIRQERGWGDDTVLISIGRLGEEKNFTTLLEAAAKAFKETSNVRLVIIGDGPDEKSLHKYAKELGIANKVDFTGRIPYEDIPKFLNAADIFCFASVTETQGLVTMEAMAAGLPVVAVDATGTKDAVENGKEGLLTDNDADALAQAIEKVIGDASLREQFKEAVEKKVESFDITLQANRMLDVYEEATEAKKADRYMKVIQ